MRKFIPLLTAVFCFSTHDVSGQIASQWETTLNGIGDFGDQFNSVVVGANNDIFVTGYTVNANTDRDLFVAKYNSSAQLQWKKTFAGTGGGPDEGKKIVLHPNGNLIVSGYLNNRSVGNDFFTAMIKTNGDTVWTRNYNSPTTNLYDEPNAITIDGQGNIVVVGDSDRDPSPILNNDYLTVKYSSAGALLWTVRYNSTANDNDRAMAVVTDASNNIYVAGRVFNGGDDDFVTIKYNATGVQQWSKKYDNGGTDRPTSIGIDQSGLVYVVGRSNNGTDDDFRLLIYTGAGVQQATAFYDVAGHDRPIDMVVLPSGGCVVTGRSDGNPAIGINYDIHTVAFSATGSKLWTGIFQGSALNDDIPSAIKLGSNGSVLVTGFTDGDNTTAIKNDVVYLQYSNTGAVLAQQLYKGTPDYNDEGMDIAWSPNGNVLVVGNTANSMGHTDALLLVFKGNTTPLATQFYRGLGDNNENVRDFIIDPLGTLFYCGYSVNNNSNRDFTYGSIDDKGNSIWQRDTSGTLFGSDEEANAIAFDPTGNVVVSGYLKNAGTSSDVYVEKFDKTGKSLWKFGYDSPIHESDRANEMVINSLGEIYVVGKTDVDATWQVNDDILVLKLSATGSLLWKVTYASNTLVDRAQFVQVLSSGEVIVAGTLQNGLNDNVVVLKYSSTGALLWSKVVDFFGANDKINDMIVDNAGNVYFTGQAQKKTSATDFEAFVSCVSSAGQQVWAKYVGYSGVGLDEGVSLVMAKDNSLWVAGNIDKDSTATTNLDVFLMNYDLSGNSLLSNLATYGGASSDEVDDVEIIGTNIPCVAIHSNTSTAGDLDFAMGLLEYKNNQLNQSYQRGVSDTIDVANIIKWQASTQFLYVGGSSFSKTGQRDLLLGKYFQGVAGLQEATEPRMRIFPNPVDDQLTINSEVVGELSVYALTGTLVYQTSTNLHGPAVIDTRSWKPGIYQVVLKGQNFVYTEKIIKHK